MAEDRDQRTEQPTEKRLREAAERGQLARSRDLSGALVFAAGLATLGYGVLSGLSGWMRSTLQQAGAGEAVDLPLRLAAAGYQAFHIVAGCFLAMLVAALFGQLFPGGWNLSFKALAPDLNRLSPVNNLQRMVGHGPAELGKTLAKALVVGGIVFALLWSRRDELMGLSMLPPQQAGLGVLRFALHAAAAGAFGLLLIGFLDAPYQLWRHHRDLRMTKQEVRDEMRESEGRPEVKSKLRRMQQEISRGRMIEAVREADVVVVNPIHVAVALRYAPGSMRAPRVVAKGAGPIAERIREEAKKHRVPLLTAPPLARALYRSAKVNGEVPAALYRAVAQVLAWVYQVRSGKYDARIPDVEIPADMKEAGKPWT